MQTQITTDELGGGSVTVGFPIARIHRVVAREDPTGTLGLEAVDLSTTKINTAGSAPHSTVVVTYEVA